MSRVKEISGGHISAESQYVRRSEEDLKELALGVLRGQVFGTWMIPEHDSHLIASIFMVITFMDDIKRKELKRDGIVHFYEWIKDAGPRAINGYPMFTSCHMLNAEDSRRLTEKMSTIQKALDEI